MNDPSKRQSQRFTRTAWTEYLVPALLVLLLLALIATLVVIALSALGVTPGT